MHCQLPRIAKHVLYSCLRTLKYRTLAHLSFTNTIQTLRILKPLSHPAPDTAAATRPCSQITLGRLVQFDNVLYNSYIGCQVISTCCSSRPAVINGAPLYLYGVFRIAPRQMNFTLIACLLTSPQTNPIVQFRTSIRDSGGPYVFLLLSHLLILDTYQNVTCWT